MIDYHKFQQSLKHLEAQYNNYLRLDERTYLEEIDKEAILESTIQRFEKCYDALWKSLKRFLSHGLSIRETPNSPIPIFRMAAEIKLLAVDDVDQWIKYSHARVNTSYNFSGEKAAFSFELMGYFIADSNDLYQKITNETLNDD